MSKSLGNFTTIQDALQRYRPEVIRMFTFNAHYTNPVDYSEDSLGAAEKGWERLMAAVRLNRQRLQDAKPGTGGAGFRATIEDAQKKFTEAMDDDFNAPIALATLQTFTREVNTLLNSGETVGQETLQAIDAFYSDYGGSVLGIIPTVEMTGGADAQREAGLVNMLIDLRKQARVNKQYAVSDQIRDRLLELGVVLEDRAEGTVYRIADKVNNE